MYQYASFLGFRADINLKNQKKKMNISPVNTYTKTQYTINRCRVSFCAKNKDARKADDIMRTAANAFPMFKPTYADIFYNSLQDDKEKFYKGIAKRWYENVRLQRDDALEEDDFCEQITDLIKKQKLGNCTEASDIALMALFANEYYNSCCASLGYEISYIDKNTKKPVWSYMEPIDHICVLTNMNNPKRKYLKDLIVIDPWLGCSGSASELYGKYKNTFLNDKTVKRIKYNFQQRFASEFSGENIANTPDFSNCILSKKFVFYFAQKYREKEAREMGRKMAEKYPEIVAKKNS